MFKDLIQKPKEKESLVNPMIIFNSERLNMDGEKIQIAPLYQLTDNIFNNVLESDEIYDKKGKISFNTENNIRTSLRNRLHFIIKNAYYSAIEDVRIFLINQDNSIEMQINQICRDALGLITSADWYYGTNTTEHQIRGIISPILSMSHGNNNSYSMDLIISNVVETIYNKFIDRVEESILYFKVSDDSLTAEQYELLYEIPCMVTFSLGTKLGILFAQFIKYKQEKMELLKPKSLKFNDYDDEEDY